MEYRGVEYTIVQGFRHRGWKWGLALQRKALTGHAAIKAAAKAERAIDRARSLLKAKLIRGGLKPYLKCEAPF